MKKASKLSSLLKESEIFRILPELLKKRHLKDKSVTTPIT